MKYLKSSLAPVMIKIGENEYPSALTFNTLMHIEESCGLSLPELIDSLVQNKLTAKFQIEIIYAMLVAGGVEVTQKDIGEIDFSNEQHTNIIRALTAVLSRHTSTEIDVEMSNEDAEKK